MRTEQWDRVQSIFHSIVDLPAEQRLRAIEQNCADDETVAQAVKEMVAEDEHGHALLDSPLDDLARSALGHQHVRDLVEQQIGPYRLVRVLGEGGMGVVYLAERTDIGGLVAIKLLRDAWMSPMRRERFALEQRMMARLNHPNIARIYDSGTLSDGTPWFVMEYADGPPLTEWIARWGGGVRQDLLLFHEMCEAVRYAHSHAIVHRDIKPSNVVVTELGAVKLLDFGIAKYLESGEANDRTVGGLGMMTPAYAAPEQVNGGPIGTFTDVYALGVLLHEILTGTLPLPARDRKRDKPLPNPSTRAAPRANSSRPSPTRSEWADLDAICLTALEFDPEHRYQSVDALIHDIDAFLDGRVVSARPGGVTYAAAKFIRRNRTALLILSVSLLILLASVIAFTVRLARARNDALREIARTERLRHFTESLFDGGNPIEGRASTLSTADLLKRGQAEAESLKEDSEMQADMFATLGQAYERLGELSQADTLLKRSLDIRRAATGASGPHYAEGLAMLGLLRKDQGRMQESEDLLRNAVAVYDGSAAKTDASAAHARWALGLVLGLRGKYTESRQILEDDVRQESSLRPGTTQLGDDLAQLGDVYFYLSDYNKAAVLNQQALAIYRKDSGDGHPSVAHVLNTLGQIAQNEGRFPEAESYFRQGLAIDQLWYGPNHPEVAADLGSLAKTLISNGKYDDAKLLLDRALEIEKDTYGYEHPRVALTLNDLGLLAYTRDHYDEAENRFKEALSIWIKTYGDRHQFVGLSYANLTSVYMSRKDYPAAEQWARKALAVYTAVLPSDHVNFAIIRVKLGRILLREGRPAEAEPFTRAGHDYFKTHPSQYQSYLTGSEKDLNAIEAQLHAPKPLARPTLAAR